MGLPNNLGKLSNMITSTGSAVGVNTTTPFGIFNVVAGTNKSLIIQDSGVADTIEIASYSTSGGTRAINMNASVLTFGTGTAGGGSATARLTINSTGLATFSSSVTANGIIQAALPSGLPATFELYDSGGGTNLKYWRIESRSTDASFKYFNISSFNDGLNSLAYGMRIRVPAGSITPDQVLFPNGNIGIGASAPLSKLSIGGNGYADRAITAIASGGDFAATIQQNSTGAGLQVYSNNTNWGNTPFKIQSNGGTQFEISPNGQVNITTSSNNPLVLTNASNNQYFLINTTGGGEAMTEYRNPTAASWFVGIRTAAGLSATNGFHIYSSIYGNDVMGLFANGNYDFAGSDVSDRRLKENIEAISYNALEKINALEACSYNMINNPNVKRHGFIAQEVQKVLPDLINGDEKEDEYLGLDYNGLLAIAIKAIQELNAKVTALENKP